MSKRSIIVVTALVLILAALALQWWTRTQPPEEAAPPVAVVPPAAEPRASEPALRPPVPPPVATPLAAGEVERALADLLGRKDVMRFVQSSDFPRHFVATVDNLGRPQAPSRLWPVQPTPGRFATIERDGGPVIAPENARRYAPFVDWITSIDPARAVGLYARLYPLLQQAWRDLGYPRGEFNDRLIEVIDLLLATPAATESMTLRLTEIKGPIASTRPWVRYEFVDPTLESLSAGQKVLLRVGPAHQRRLKAQLANLRRELLQAAQTR